MSKIRKYEISVDKDNEIEKLGKENCIVLVKPVGARFIPNYSKNAKIGILDSDDYKVTQKKENHIYFNVVCEITDDCDSVDFTIDKTDDNFDYVLRIKINSFEPHVFYRENGLKSAVFCLIDNRDARAMEPFKLGEGRYLKDAIVPEEIANELVLW